MSSLYLTRMVHLVPYPISLQRTSSKMGFRCASVGHSRGYESACSGQCGRDVINRDPTATGSFYMSSMNWAPCKDESLSGIRYFQALTCCAAWNSVDRKGKHIPRWGNLSMAKFLALSEWTQFSELTTKWLRSWELMTCSFIFLLSWYQSNAGFMSELQHSPSSSSFGKTLCRTEVIYSINVW
jgi:hypothetical protein